MPLQHLFDTYMEYDVDVAAVVSSEGREGEYIGSGIGQVKGDRITGTIRWSMFAADFTSLLSWSGAPTGPGKQLRRVHPGGYIETRDGARIQFDARGYARRGTVPDQPHRWWLAGAVLFATEDSRYEWLNITLGLWEGAFDERSGRARYQTYGAHGPRAADVTTTRAD